MTTAEPQRRQTALIVEDDDQIAALLKFMIERDGFEVLAAADGRAAQQIVESAAPPAIVILDLMLPYIDGFQLVDMIRAKPEWKNVPIIMLTAKSQESDIVRALDAGANDYIIKPFKPEELKARIKRLLRPGK
jgi:two-component system alkaline phosphatase synthesis response regulator PhoP